MLVSAIISATIIISRERGFDRKAMDSDQQLELTDDG
jgi:hypothetical protein